MNKKVSLILSALVIAAMMLSSCGGDSLKEEGASNEVTIGTQVWMTKNLDVSTFRNGDPIPHAKTEEEWLKANQEGQPAWCYYDNDPANGKKYGKLYNWYAVNDLRRLAPAGYHVPSDAEWKVLTDYLGGEYVAGKKMKSTSGWFDEGNGTNESGFNGLPGGNRKGTGTFGFIGLIGNFWSSTEFNSYFPWFRFLFHNDDNFFSNYNVKFLGLSVRCLKD